ncbi:MAG: amidase family protein [Sneathiellaceae bacterium]
MTISFDEYRALGAADLVAAYRTHALSPVEAAETALAAIAAIDPKINAVFHVAADAALAEARASQARWLAGRPAGPLDGVPTVVKDGLPMRGVPVYRGSIALAAHARPPEFDAPAVARLREDGAVLLGKTSMCDFGMLGSGYSSMFGPARNPWDLDRTSGGSSSGSCAAVAAGLVPVAVGTDIVGSIRLPASFCGLAGLKPSYGRVPLYPNSSPAAVAGPLARNVADMALLLGTIARPDPRDFAALPYDPNLAAALAAGPPVPGRVGVLRSIGFGPDLDPEVAALVAAALDRLADLGWALEEVASPVTPEDAATLEDFYRLRPLAELDALPEDARRAATVLDAWSGEARAFTGLQHYRQFLKTQEVRERMLALAAPFDLLALPTVPVPAYAAELPTLPGQSLHAPFANTLLFNLTEQPAVSLNCGFTRAGLPVGLQLVGRRHDDAGLLRLAHALEGALGLRPDWPDLT